MSLEFEIPLLSLVFIILLGIFYLTKPKINLLENRYFCAILIFSFIECLLSVIAHVITATHSYEVIISTYKPLITLINMFVATSFVSIFLSLFIYILIISYKKVRNNEKTIRLLSIIFAGLFLLATCFMKIDIIEVGSVTNIRGSMIMLAYGFVFFFLFLSIIVSLINIKRRDIRYLSIYVIILVLLIMYFATLFLPGIILYDFALTLLCYIMYFTIENPDVKLLEELYENKIILERSNDEMANFAFKLTQDIKKPIKSIIDITNNKDNLEINTLAKQIDYSLNSVLDLANNNIKIYNTRYNPSKLFDEIRLKVNNLIDDNIIFDFNISENIPTYVYGDSIVLKQLFTSLIKQALNNTDEYISIDINTIIKYDTCRFLVDLNYSGKGYSLETINKVLSINEEFDNLKIDKSIIDLYEIKRLVQSFDGRFMIRSEEGQGSTISITYDQKIFVANKNKSNRLSKYEASIIKGKRVAVSNEDSEILNDIKNLFTKENIIVDALLDGNRIIDKINDENAYSLIILDGESKESSALTILNKLKENKKFNTPVYIILDDNKKNLEKHLISDGFSGVIFKSELKKELKKVLNKFIV